MFSHILMTVFLFASSASASEVIPSLNIIKEEAPFPGYVYRPNDELSHPAIVLLHGSEGGNGDFWYEPGNKPTNTGANAMIPYMARYYAMLGYVTYAVCYFDCKHHVGYKDYPPDDLKNVDLMKTTYPALAWLKSYKYVDNKKVILWGASRGAEQVIFLASKLTELKANDPSIILPDGVVAMSPLEMVAPGFPQAVADAIIAGQEPDFSSGAPSAWLINGVEQQMFQIIPIAKFPNPVLIVSFKNDPVWGMVDMTKLKDQYGTGELLSISILPTDLATDKSAEIPTSFGRVTFLDLMDTGHVFPPFGSEESKVVDETLRKFFTGVLN